MHKDLTSRFKTENPEEFGVFAARIEGLCFNRVQHGLIVGR